MNEDYEIKITEKEKGWATVSHIITLIGLLIYIVTLAGVAVNILILKNLLSLIYLIIPVVVNIAIPLIMWGSLRNISPFVKENCKQSLNFQLSVTFYFIISIASVFIIIGIVLIFILILFDISSVIDAYKKAKKGENYRYLYTINFIR